MHWLNCSSFKPTCFANPTKFLDDAYGVVPKQLRYFCIQNNITEIPQCICGNKVTYKKDDPKKGFDSAWHTKKAKLNAGLGEHLTHDWQAVKAQSGPHEGKAICNTCGGKFIMWLPKGYFNSNT